MDLEVVGILVFFLCYKNSYFGEVTMSVTWICLVFPPNYATHVFSQSYQRSSVFFQFLLVYKGKCLQNDLVETKYKDPYSNCTDVI